MKITTTHIPADDLIVAVIVELLCDGKPASKITKKQISDRLAKVYETYGDQADVQTPSENDLYLADEADEILYVKAEGIKAHLGL